MSRANIRYYQLACAGCLVSILLTCTSLARALPEPAAQILSTPQQAQTVQSQVQQQQLAATEPTKLPPSITPTATPTQIKQILVVNIPKDLGKALKSTANRTVKAIGHVTERPPNSKLVNVESASNGSKVNVHVPLVFDMTNDNAPGRSKLDLSVLGGFVKVSKDRTRQPNGPPVGPLTVTIFGIPVYTGFRAPEDRRSKSDNLYDMIAKQEKELDAFKEPQFKDQPDSHESLLHTALTSYKNTNEIVLRSLADMLSKAAVLVNDKTIPIENVNGEAAATREKDLVVPSKFSELDLKPKQADRATVEDLLKKTNLLQQTNKI